MSNVVAFASRIVGQHFRVRRDGGWAVQLVTPKDGQPLATTIAWHSCRDMATVHARDCALRVGVPFKEGRASL